MDIKTAAAYRGRQFGQTVTGYSLFHFDSERHDGQKVDVNVNYIWAKCPKCSKGKWQVKTVGVEIDKITATTQCRECYLKWRAELKHTIGTRLRTKQGYVDLIIDKNDSCGIGKTRIQEHRYVMAKSLGRPLLKAESVHHKNGVRDDNRIENLELWASCHRAGQRLVDVIENKLRELTPEDLCAIINKLPYKEELLKQMVSM